VGHSFEPAFLVEMRRQGHCTWWGRAGQFMLRRAGQIKSTDVDHPCWNPGRRRAFGWSTASTREQSWRALQAGHTGEKKTKIRSATGQTQAGCTADWVRGPRSKGGLPTPVRAGAEGEGAATAPAQLSRTRLVAPRRQAFLRHNPPTTATRTWLLPGTFSVAAVRPRRRAGPRTTREASGWEPPSQGGWGGARASSAPTE